MGLIQTKVVRETYTVSAMLELFDCGILRDDHPQQRRAEQHSTSYRDGFIATVIKQEDFDSLKICEQKKNGANILWLIDGLQRLSEIRGYRNGTFKLGHKIEEPVVSYQRLKKDEKDEGGNPVYETLEFDLNGKSYFDLPKELQLQFDLCPVDIVKHLDCTDEEVSYHIRRYNHQTAMNGAQTSITYAGRWASKIKDISLNNTFFLNCGQYTAMNIKKGVIDRIIMESVMSTFHLEDWKKQTDRMGSFINDNATEDEFDTMNDYFNRLCPIAEDKYKDYFNPKNTLIFMPVFHKFVGLGLEDKRFEDFLDAIEHNLHAKEIDGLSLDILEENRATKDRTVIKQKVDFLIKLMLDYFGITENEIDDLVFLSEITGMDQDELLKDLDYYNQCLDDSMDRVVEFKSKLREPNNRLPLIAILILAHDADLDVEPWMKWYSTHNTIYPLQPKDNFNKMFSEFKKFREERRIA